MDISRQFISNPVRVWLTILLLGVGGIIALLNIGRLEDPAFTIKTAVVITIIRARRRSRLRKRSPCRWKTRFSNYLTDNVSSISSSGLSQITVNIASRYHSNALPQIWDELRRRVGDAARQFPPGVVTPFVNDDFGDVFGFSLPFPAMNSAIRNWSGMPSSCAGSWSSCRVGKVAIGGALTQQINVDISLSKMAARG